MIKETLSIPSRIDLSRLQTKLGAMLIKPDAVNLGVAEPIIAHVSKKLYEEQIGTISGVYLIDGIPISMVPILYPSLPVDGCETVSQYLSDGMCVLAFFEGSGNVDMWAEMTKLKGRRMNDWSIEELGGAVGLNNFIRAMLPVPGTRDKYFPVIDKIILKKRDKSARFTDAEFQIYCRNLVHTPDNIDEFCGLLELISDEQKRELLTSIAV